MDVAVLGSLNVDVVFQCADFPKPGETILCEDSRRGPGGKGLNQAVAAARAGASTAMIGAVGQDGDGDYLLNLIGQDQIDVSRISRLANLPTGLAHIIIDRHGENSIVVSSGANASPLLEQTSAAEIRASVRLAQLEVPVAAVKKFFAGAGPEECCILNAAPARDEAREVFPECDIVIVNEHELAHFVGLAAAPCNGDDIALAARTLITRPEQAVLVTLGAQGTQLVTLDENLVIGTRAVTPVDTTGAGDCFCGVLAERLSQSASLEEAVHFANMAASIAVTREGAASAMPAANDIREIAQSA